MVEDYLNGGTIRSLAAKYGITGPTINNTLRRLGVPLKPRGAPKGNTNRLGKRPNQPAPEPPLASDPNEALAPDWSYPNEPLHFRRRYANRESRHSLSLPFQKLVAIDHRSGLGIEEIASKHGLNPRAVEGVIRRLYRTRRPQRRPVHPLTESPLDSPEPLTDHAHDRHLRQTHGEFFNQFPPRIKQAWP